MALPVRTARAVSRRGGGCSAAGRVDGRFKQVLAFPLYATVAWLAWVLGAQRDNDAVVRLLLALLCLGFALWTWRIVRTGGARPWGIAGVAALAGSAALAWPLFTADADAAQSAASTRRVPAGDADKGRAKTAVPGAHRRAVEKLEVLDG